MQPQKKNLPYLILAKLMH